MSFIYIASPYSHPAFSIREQRFEAVSEYTASMVKEGIVAYSPIAHSHPLAETYGIRGDFAFWAHQNYGMLCKASELRVLKLPGWESSEGVEAEIEFAHQCGIPVLYVDGH